MELMFGFLILSFLGGSLFPRTPQRIHYFFIGLYVIGMTIAYYFFRKY